MRAAWSDRLAFSGKTVQGCSPGSISTWHCQEGPRSSISTHPKHGNSSRLHKTLGYGTAHIKRLICALLPTCKDIRGGRYESRVRF